MELFKSEVLPINLQDEMEKSYLDYAMSVIVGRALPDVRDGLKPVHRRVLFAMHELHNDYNKPYKKSARIVGDVIGKYHPHGDSAVYDTIVRMAQDFSLRNPLVDGQGNFGSVDGDSAAAMRYTEIRMSKIAHEMLADIEKQTVDFGPNYDGSEKEPLILPTKIPNLLINGSSGIAVGMATNIAPHNLSEVIDACIALLDNPNLEIWDLMQFVPAPDFPTGAYIYGVEGVKQAYATGRGRVVMRAKTHFEDLERGRVAIIVDELPYQVNKASLCEKIADLVREKRIEGISTLRDESDKSGMRVVIELKKDQIAEVILNQLYKETSLQESFSINSVCLVDGQPRLLNLKQLIDYFLRHRREVITRRTRFDLQKAKERGHLLEGLNIALSHVDDIVQLIKTAENPATARNLLETRYQLSEVQSQAILELRLQRLTGMEQSKIQNEHKEILLKIADLSDILANRDRVTEIIRQELSEVKLQFHTPRRSEIVINTQEINKEDLIKPEDRLVTISHSGYIKAQSLDAYSKQRRGGVGKQAMATKDDDFVEKMFIANTHDYLLCFSNLGRLYWLKVYDIPEGSRTSKGKPMVNLFPLAENEKVNTVLAVKQFDEGHYVVMATSNGRVKKTPLTEFSRPRSGGIIALSLEENDYMIGASITDGSYDIMLFSTDAKSVRFAEEEVRPMGRTAQGVLGMKISDNQQIISLVAVNNEEDYILTATENGYGKRTRVEEYTRHGRNTKGMFAMKFSSSKGCLISAILVRENDEVMLITTGGTLVRTEVKQISESGRVTQGVRLINISEDKLVGISRIEEIQGDNEDNDNESEDSNIDLDHNENLNESLES